MFFAGDKKLIYVGLGIVCFFLVGLQADDNSFSASFQAEKNALHYKIQKISEILQTPAIECSDFYIKNNEQRKHEVIDTVRFAAGYLTTLAIISKFVEFPNSFTSLILKTFAVLGSTVVVGAMLGFVYQPIAALLVECFGLYDGCTVKNNAFEDFEYKFFKDWAMYRPCISQPLVESFDKVYQNYIKNGGKITLPEQEVQALFICLLSSMLFDAHMNVQQPVDSVKK